MTQTPPAPPRAPSSVLPDALSDWRPAPAAHAQAPVLVGYSGGMDSHALLHALANLRGAAALRAVHVDHDLQADSAAWARHCADVCAALGVALDIRRVRVERDGPLGLEGAARAARRAAFAASLRPGEVLALAQHRDDQAETFLLRALRASGSDGLAAMRPWRPFAAGWLWRPLLAVPRQALQAYARAQGLRWVDDPTNLETDRDRNFLRHRVLPLLRERWPQADAALARSAALSAESADLLQDEDARLLAAAACGDGDGLSVPALRAWPASRRARLLRRWVAQGGRTSRAGDGGAVAQPVGAMTEERTTACEATTADGIEADASAPPLPAAGVAWVESALLGETHDTRARFAWAGWRIRRWRDGLYLLRDDEDAEDVADAEQAGDAQRTPAMAATAASVAIAAFVWPPGSSGADDDAGTRWDGAAPLALPGGGRLCLDGAPHFASPLWLRPRRGGERIRLPGRGHRHRLKQVLQEHGIPPWARARLPLLFAADGELLAAGDRILAADFAAWLEARGARLRWERG